MTPYLCSQWPYLFSLQSLNDFLFYFEMTVEICQTRLSERSKSLFFVLRGTLFVICISPVIHLVPPPRPQILRTAVPRETENNAYAQFWVANNMYFARYASGKYQFGALASPVCSTCSFRFLARKLEDFRIGTVGFYQYIQMKDRWRPPYH